jgi:hypothetical protein
MMRTKIKSWLKAAWGWLKRNWKWILFPIGILVALLPIFRKGREMIVVQGGKPDTAALIALKQQETDKKIQEAEKAQAEAIKKIEEEHKATMDALTQAQKKKYEQLKKQGPRAIADWLRKVGKGAT